MSSGDDSLRLFVKLKRPVRCRSEIFTITGFTSRSAHSFLADGCSSPSKTRNSYHKRTSHDAKSCNKAPFQIRGNVDQQTLSLSRLAPLIRCAALVLTIWGIVGSRLQSTPGWLAVVTGCCVGISAWFKPHRANGKQRKLVDLAALALFCWALIIAGRFVCTLSGVNHGILWLAYRSATDEDGIAILSGDLSEERVEAAANGNAAIHSVSAINAHSEEDLREARERWKSLNDEKKAWFLERWRATVNGANQLAWSMIHRNSFTMAYEGTNLFWHLTGIAVAIVLGAGSTPKQSTGQVNL